MNDNNVKVLEIAVQEIFARNDQAIKSTIESRRGKKAVRKSDLEFALTLMLVEIASSDQQFDEAEYDRICGGMARLFGTTRPEVTFLIEKAKLQIAQYRGSSDFVELLRKNLSKEEIGTVMEVIDEVINADGVQDGFEIYHRHRFAKLLGLAT